MTQHTDAPPPSYEETESTQPAISRPVPPPDAQRAVAPLVVQRTNGSITGDYVVQIGENKSAPDVTFKTTNGAITVTVHLQGTVPRQAGVDVRTTNGAIKIATVREPGQAVNIAGHTTNGRVVLILPWDFSGLVTTRSVIGSIQMSPEVKRNSIIVPGDSKSTTYRISPRETDDNNTASAEIEDVANVASTNGAISLEYYGEVKVQETKGSSCVIA